MLTTKESFIDGLWTGDMKCTGPKAKERNLRWRRLEPVQSSRKRRGGLRSGAMCSQLSLSGGGLARLGRTLAEAEREVIFCGS